MRLFFYLKQTVLDVLLTVQPKFKSDLLTAVDQLKADVTAFEENYHKVCIPASRI